MSKPDKLGTVRIIAGQWRGRRLPVVDHAGLRPTTDRVRETVFNWLMQDIEGAHCLDMFAGTGVLGFECLSRGATSLVFIESSRELALGLEKTIKTLQAASATVINQNSIAALAQLGSAPCTALTQHKFDLVFIDPPFDSNYLFDATRLLEEKGCLSDNAIIYVEHAAKQSNMELPKNWHRYKSGAAGQSAYGLFRRQSDL